MAKSRKGDLVSIQLDIRVNVPTGKRLTRSLVEQAVRLWADTGATPKGFRIRIKDWKHGGKNGKKVTPEDTGSTQEEVRERFRGLLRAGRYNFKVRGGKTL